MGCEIYNNAGVPQGSDILLDSKKKKKNKLYDEDIGTIRGSYTECRG